MRHSVERLDPDRVLNHVIANRSFPLLLLFLIPIARADSELPEGPAPPALEFPWFPDRMHAFVWRNWNLIETARIASVLGTSPANVRTVAESMGLPAEEPVSPRFKARMYLTVIRRNWHLLPYDQLLQLLDWTPQQLAFTLREDDFLFIKLGSLKPRCARLTYVAPVERTKQREREIRGTVASLFGESLREPAEPRLAFLDRFEKPVPAGGPVQRAHAEGLRFIYSYFAVYGDPLLDPALDPYPDELLRQLAARGVNGVWLHTVLRDLAPSTTFPEFGEGHERRLDNLRKLVGRARRFGIGVYLYMNEPRAQPAAFFRNRADMAGVREGPFIAMCTSNPLVRQWLSDSLEYVFKSVPDLGGVFTITGSENLTNCASHQHQADCPRCGKRSGAEVITEVNSAIEAGVHRGNPDAKVIVWDWGWPDEWTPQIIVHLPRSIWFMSVSEWSTPIERGGVKSLVGEYSISAVGPGARALNHWALARAVGLKTVAKVQVNNSWEISAVPSLPVLDLVAEHCHRLADAKVDGLMLSWSLGGYPSPNLQVAQRLLDGSSSSTEQVLDQIADERFGAVGAPHARKAWTLFSQAFKQYPFDAGVIYSCPVQYGPANLLFEKPTGYAATMTGFPYDDLNTWRGPYPADVFTSQFQRIAERWAVGISELKQANDAAPILDRSTSASDLRWAQAAGIHFRSVANQAHFVIARRELSDEKASVELRQRAGNELHKTLEDEMSCAKQLFSLTRVDSAIGFEASNQYYYLPQDLMEKAINCRYLVDRFAEKK